MSDSPLLEIKGLQKYYEQQSGLLQTLLRKDPNTVHAVDDVSLTLREQESIGVIGESGCGKTTLLHTIMGLHSPTGGKIVYKGKDVSSFTKADWKDYRKNISIIFQDPFNSLDPKRTVRETVREPLKIHRIGDHEERVARSLRRAELTPPSQYLDQYPKQLSGGEKQRVSIARALVTDPDVILADEPVSMLDVSTQAAVLNLLSEIIDETGTSMFYISHDLSTVSYICRRINVMYLGHIVESGPTEDLLNDPKHPYSQALIDAIPIPDPHANRKRTDMEGSPLTPVNMGEGCRFRDRCPERMDICEKTPVSIEVEDDWNVACHLYYDHEEYTNANGHPLIKDNERSAEGEGEVESNDSLHTGTAQSKGVNTDG